MGSEPAFAIPAPCSVTPVKSVATMTQFLAEDSRVGDRDEMKVWDPFVRTFHWSLVALFAIAFVTQDSYELVHQSAGYAILALVALRIFWGFIGSEHARFRDFVYSPREVARFLFDSMTFRAKRYIGHNPAGGVMVIALLLMLLVVCVTGVMLIMDAFWGQKWVEEAHKCAVAIMLGLIGLHLVGILVASIEHGENLVRSMLTGRKRAAQSE
jgi:cytochrome b